MPGQCRDALLLFKEEEISSYQMNSVVSVLSKNRLDQFGEGFLVSYVSQI